jgi:hypothetical protein
LRPLIASHRIALCRIESQHHQQDTEDTRFNEHRIVEDIRARQSSIQPRKLRLARINRTLSPPPLTRRRPRRIASHRNTSERIAPNIHHHMPNRLIASI